MTDEQRNRAASIVATVHANLARWRGWFPDELSGVEVPRIDLLALVAVAEEFDKLRVAVAKHHGQKADDRCQFDDDELYAAAGLPPADRRVGDKVAMLANCARFIERRCEGGGPWRSYAELEAENAKLREFVGTAWRTACDASEVGRVRYGLTPDLSPMCDLKELELTARKLLDEFARQIQLPGGGPSA